MAIEEECDPSGSRPDRYARFDAMSLPAIHDHLGRLSSRYAGVLERQVEDGAGFADATTLADGVGDLLAISHARAVQDELLSAMEQGGDAEVTVAGRASRMILDRMLLAARLPGSGISVTWRGEGLLD